MESQVEITYSMVNMVGNLFYRLLEYFDTLLTKGQKQNVKLLGANQCM